MAAITCHCHTWCLSTPTSKVKTTGEKHEQFDYILIWEENWLKYKYMARTSYDDSAHLSTDISKKDLSVFSSLLSWRVLQEKKNIR